MAMNEPPIVESGLLLVEEKNDKNVFECMFRHMRIARIRVHPIDCKAVSGSARKLAKVFRCLGFRPGCR